MSFVYPLGLLGLIGIPILILIYILKNKYTEQVIPSTYIWNLSEKFLKIRRPISKVSGIISLILQIIAVILVSLTIAHPKIKLTNQAREYCFILDASGSMNMLEEEGITRWDIGKKKINDIINASVDGSRYTLIYVGETTRVIYEDIENKNKALELLKGLNVSDANANCVDSLEIAQEYYNSNTSLMTYLVTDKSYKTTNIELIFVAKNQENFAIYDTTYKKEGFNLKISGNVISYNSSEELKLKLYIDDEEIKEQNIFVEKAIEKEFNFEIENREFHKIKVQIENQDSLAKDNESILYNLVEEHANKALLISDTPQYLKTAIYSLGMTSLDVISPTKYSSNIQGYGLYIFDCFNPASLPQDGAVWLINTNESIPHTEFSVQEPVEIPTGVILSYSKNSSSQFKKLTEDMIEEEIYVSKYIKYGLNRKFTDILNIGGIPVVFVGTNYYGNREVVFSFDLHDSNLAMLQNFLILIRNLLEYSFPTILEEKTYYCGDTISVNVLPNCKSIKLIAPSGKSIFMDVSDVISEYQVSEVGSYKIIMNFTDDQKEFDIFVHLPKEEGASKLEVVELGLQGEASEQYADGFYDNLMILFIVLAVIFMADWMVYCYEQYQLR